VIRIVIAAALAIVILGGLKVYITLRERLTTAAPQIVTHTATGKYDVEVTLSFDAGPNEFSLNPDEAPALVVGLGARELLRRTDPVPAGAVTIENVEGLAVGANELFVSAWPRDGASTAPRAARVRVFQDGRLLAERTLWSEPGQPVRGPIPITIGPAPKLNSHDDNGDSH
jgi:hypothetical protein